MYCIKCGTLCRQDARFCSKCGVSITKPPLSAEKPTIRKNESKSVQTECLKGFTFRLLDHDYSFSGIHYVCVHAQEAITLQMKDFKKNLETIFASKVVNMDTVFKYALPCFFEEFERLVYVVYITLISSQIVDKSQNEIRDLVYQVCNLEEQLKPFFEAYIHLSNAYEKYKFTGKSADLTTLKNAIEDRIQLFPFDAYVYLDLAEYTMLDFFEIEQVVDLLNIQCTYELLYEGLLDDYKRIINSSLSTCKTETLVKYIKWIKTSSYYDFSLESLYTKIISS